MQKLDEKYIDQIHQQFQNCYIQKESKFKFDIIYEILNQENDFQPEYHSILATTRSKAPKFKYIESNNLKLQEQINIRQQFIDHIMFLSSVMGVLW